MNAFEIAEITAELSRRGVAGQLRIRTIPVGARRRNGILQSIEATTIDNRHEHIATISPHSEGGYFAIDKRYRAQRGTTRATALANLLDATT